MRYIIAILLSLVFATSVQADQSWVCWERYIAITGQKAEINQLLAKNVESWKAIGLFQEKERCEEYVIALSTYKGKEWEGMTKTTGYEIFYLFPTDDSYGRYAGILTKTGQNQWNVAEWKCLPPKSDAAVIGAGLLSCGKWLEDFRHSLAGHHQNMQWIYGFLSGVNWHTSGPQAKPPDVEGLAAFVDFYCRNNPLHPIGLAAAALVQDMGGPKASHQWKR